MERWAGRVALVTGASAGIGSAIVKALVRHKMKVVGCGRQIDKIQALANELSAEHCDGLLDPVKCDLRQESDIKDMISMIQSKYGGLDVCINNAGLMQRAPILSGSTEAWREMFEVNVLALTIITREAFLSMEKKGIDDGQIINICSMAGHRATHMVDNSFYQATKSAVRFLTEGTRVELRHKKSHIRVAEISPGLVDTEFFSTAGGQKFSDKILKSLQPIQAKDIADTVVYILSAPPHVEVNDVLMRPTEQVL